MSKEFKNIDELFRSELGGNLTAAPSHVKANIDKALGFNRWKKGLLFVGLALILSAGGVTAYLMSSDQDGLTSQSTLATTDQNTSLSLESSPQEIVSTNFAENDHTENGSEPSTSEATTETVDSYTEAPISPQSNTNDLISINNSQNSLNEDGNNDSNPSSNDASAENTLNETATTSNFINQSVNNESDGKTEDAKDVEAIATHTNTDLTEAGIAAVLSDEDSENIENQNESNEDGNEFTEVPAENMLDQELSENNVENGEANTEELDESQDEKINEDSNKENDATTNATSNESSDENDTAADPNALTSDELGDLPAEALTSIDPSIKPTYKPWTISLTSGINVVNSAYKSDNMAEKALYNNATEDRIGNQTNLDISYRLKKGLAFGTGIGFVNYVENYDFATYSIIQDSIESIEYEYDTMGVLVDSTFHYTVQEQQVEKRSTGQNRASYIMVPVHFGTQVPWRKFQFDLFASARFNFLTKTSGAYLEDNNINAFHKNNSIYKPFYVDVMLGGNMHYNFWKNLYLTGTIKYRPVIGTTLQSVSFDKSFDYIHLGMGLSIKL